MRPQAFRFFDDETGSAGFLALDSAYNGSSVGGVRILPDVTAEEVSAMARIQTRKYLFTGIPLGGAKAGLALKAGADRSKALRAFGRALSGHIRRGFWPGCDMGSSVEDVRQMLKGAGIPTFSRQAETSSHTAAGLAASIDMALEMKGMGWSGCRIAIEGFGNVGSALALMAEGKGASIVSLSNTAGSIHDPRGLDIASIHALRSEHGSGFISRCGQDVLPRESVFRAVCDVFVPCARCWSLEGGNAARIKAPIIACGSNVPMSDGTEHSLWKSGKTVIPDSVANCGGVLGGALERFAGGQEIRQILYGRYRERVAEVIGSGMPPQDYLGEFFRRREEELKDELAPRDRPALDFIAGAVSHHLVDRIHGKARIVRGLFPR